jgi:hypothetical protein
LEVFLVLYRLIDIALSGEKTSEIPGKTAVICLFSLEISAKQGVDRKEKLY